MKQKLIIITGPTGSGKTDLAVRLAKKFNGEIIGADSRQIYKGMKIGTAQIAGLPSGDDAVLTHNAGVSRNAATSTPSLPLKKGEGREGDAASCPRGQQRSSDRESEQRLARKGNSDINSAKATAIKYKGVRHYLIGFLKPDKIFSVAEFKKMATEIIGDILKRGKVPFLVGGTAHYLEAFADGLAIPPVPPDWKLRKKLEKKSLKILIGQLKKLDPLALEIVDLKNKRRVIRALEVCLSGLKFSEERKKTGAAFKILQLGIDVPRKELYRRIDRRAGEMVKQGLIKETKNLVKVFIKKKLAVQKIEIIPRSSTGIPAAIGGLGSNRKWKIENGKNQFPVSNFHNPIWVDGSIRGVASTRQIAPTGRIGQFPVSIQQISKTPALSGIGYREIIDYLKGETTLDEASQLIKYRTHKYVRHQMNWFRKNKKIYWVRNCQEAEKIIKKFL